MVIPSSPEGFKANDIMYNYGRTWQFSFNAKKSTGLVYGEDYKAYQKSHDLMNFRLGPDRIHER